MNIDEPFIRQTATGNEYYHRDVLGSSLVLSNAQGVSATTYTYEPFGKTTVTGVSTNPFQYTGRENDGTGLYYYRARHYSPRMGRFVSEDPINFWGGDVNFYGYVKNNPTNFTDSTGQFVDTLADIGLIGYDLYRLLLDGRKNLGGNLTALGLDAGGAFIPFVAGLGPASRAAAKNLDNIPASAPVGRSGNPLDVSHGGHPVPPTNPPATINGRDYSGHALDDMQGGGIPPSVVQNTIDVGTRAPGKYPGTTTHYDPGNNTTVVTNSTNGTVVSVRQGTPR